MDAAVVAVLSELLYFFFTLKEQTTAQKAFLCGQDFFTLVMIGLGKRMAKPYGTLWLHMGQ